MNKNKWYSILLNKLLDKRRTTYFYLYIVNLFKKYIYIFTKIS